MPDNETRPSQDRPWENGWAPDTSRAPGTRRLYVAGALAVATVAACVTAIAMNERQSDEESQAREGRTTSASQTGPGLISFNTPSAGAGTTAPGKKHPSSSAPSPSSSVGALGSAAPGASSDGSSAPASTTKPPSDGSGGSSGGGDDPPATVQRSVRSVNYPDRYWHVSDGLVKVQSPGGSEFREDATFTVVQGLADSSCYSFATADGRYLRHREFVLRSDRNDGSSLFTKDATFCPRASSYSGAVMLESVNYPGRFLRHKNFQVRLDPYQYSDLYRADSAFRLVDGLD